MPQLIIEIQDMTAPGVKREVSKTFGSMSKQPKEIKKAPPAPPGWPRPGRRPRSGIRSGNCPYLSGLV